MIYIDAVKDGKDAHGCIVIIEVKWTDELTAQATKKCSKASMIDYINKNPDNVMTKYLRNGDWVKGEHVHVVDNSYLRTDANQTKKDNLDSLPRYY